MDTLMENEEDQIRGLTYILDGSGFGLKHFTITSPRMAMKFLKNAEVTLVFFHEQNYNFLKAKSLLITKWSKQNFPRMQFMREGEKCVFSV